MLRSLATILFLAGPTQVQAQTPDPLDGIIVRQSDCRMLQRHVPAADVAHQPGLDAKGRVVAPADIQDGRPNLVPPTVSFGLSVNPVDYAARNKAAKDKAAAIDRVAATDAELKAAQANSSTLASQKTALQTALSSATDPNDLTDQKGVWDTKIATDRAAIVAATGGAGATGVEKKVQDSRLAAYDRSLERNDSYQSFLSAYGANTTAQTAVDAKIAANSAVIAAAPGRDSAARLDQLKAEGQAARLDSKGLSSTTMTLGTIAYDIGANRLTLDGQPLTSAQEEVVSDACRRQGYLK